MAIKSPVFFNEITSLQNKDKMISYWDQMVTTFSPIMMVGAFVLPLTTVGIMEASTTLRPSTPYTLSLGSTTAPGSEAGPILALPE